MPLYKFERHPKPKGRCPSCGEQGCFRYYDGFAQSEFGRCDRTNKCGYHCFPTGEGKGIKKMPDAQFQEIEQVFVSDSEVSELENTDTAFHKWAVGLGVPLEHLLRWGVLGDRKGKTVFVMRGADGKVWNIKMVHYGENGKRKSDLFSMKQPDDPFRKYLVPLYGANLLSQLTKNRVVCLVESEKTAVIASYFYPQYDWVAVSSATGLTEQKLPALLGRVVWNIRDADIAGRSTCSGKKIETCTTPLQCEKCRVPHIEKVLHKAGIEYYYLDLFPDRHDGYDLADAIADGKRPYLPDYVSVPILVQEQAAEKERTAEEEEAIELGLPPGTSVADFKRYGFYEYEKSYYMPDRTGKRSRISNFMVRVKYLTIGANPIRFVEIENSDAEKRVVELKISDLISVTDFRRRVEALGNFLFYGTDAQLMRIKEKLFKEEIMAKEINTPGWQKKEGFWAWGNGIYYKGNFFPVDDDGMVCIEREREKKDNDKPDKQAASPVEKDWYYLPNFSAANMKADEISDINRFRHIENSKATFEEWAKLFCQVYGDNGKVGLIFYIMSLFRDIIFERTSCTPMLFLFGKRGSGKGTMAQSLMKLFGYGMEPLMLGGASTPVGMMRRTAQVFNALGWFDEYKNTIGDKKIEAIKNIWDGIGSIQGQRTNDNSTKSTPVRLSVMLSGQEVPNREPALFSRLLLLIFTRTSNYTEDEIREYNALLDMEITGLTKITNSILDNRQTFEATFKRDYISISDGLRRSMRDTDIIERQIKNVAIILSTCKVLIDIKVPLPFDFDEFYKIVVSAMKEQTAMMKTSNELLSFWHIVCQLIENKVIHFGRDYEIKGNNVLIRTVNVINLYSERSIRQGQTPLDKGTLVQYMKVCDSYNESESNKRHRFAELDNPTSAMVFNYEGLERLFGVSLWEYVGRDIANKHNEGDKEGVAEAYPASWG